MPEKTRREPWPLILGLMLGAMISVSITFYFIAATHPDPVVSADSR